MKFTEYIPLAVRTAVVFDDTQKSYDLVFMGVVIRIGELLDCYKKHLIYDQDLDIKNVKEKIGWICWYAAFGLHLTKQEEKTTYIKEKDAVEIIRRILLDITNWIYYGHSFVNLYSIPDCLSKLCEQSGLDFEKILDENIEKLKLKHPEYFE